MIDETLLLTYGTSAHVVRKVNTNGADGWHQSIGRFITLLNLNRKQYHSKDYT